VDPDHDPISFTIENKPNWANFDTSSGALFGVPFLGSDGMYENIVISCSDGSMESSMEPFSIMVQADDGQNQPPEISGNPPRSVLVDERYSFTPNASDPDGDALMFSLSNNPDWLSIDTGTGEVSGTPDANDLGAHGRIRIAVSDGDLETNLPLFTVTVVTDNEPPEISGTPATTVTVGQTYSFTPDAMDPEGDTLRFGIENLPGWAAFEPATGEISGTPEAGEEGTYRNIVISVTDNVNTSELPAFSIEVEAVSSGTGTAALTWDAPTKNTDDSDLTDLVGYVVYYGTSQNQMNTQVPVDGAANTFHTVENLSPGTYYFGVAAKNQAGMVSEMSNIASKTIR
jgi:hypothetical protein